MSPIVPGGLRDRSLLRAVSRGLMALLVLSIITFAALEVLGRIIDPWVSPITRKRLVSFDRLISEEPIGYRLPLNERAVLGNDGQSQLDLNARPRDTTEESGRGPGDDAR